MRQLPHEGYSVDTCVLVVEEVNDAEQWSPSDAGMYWPETTRCMTKCVSDARV